MYRDQMACEEERGSLFYAMYEQQQDMMEFMRESQRQTNYTLRSVAETQVTMVAQQVRLQAAHARDFALVNANQVIIIGNLQSLQTSNASLSAWVQQLQISQGSRHRSRSREPLHPDQLGEESGGHK